MWLQIELDDVEAGARSRLKGNYLRIHVRFVPAGASRPDLTGFM